MLLCLTQTKMWVDQACLRLPRLIIPILTVHDSVIVQLRYAGALDQLMKETYKLVTKKGDIKTDILPIKGGLGSIETGATKKRTKRYLKEQRLHNLLYNGHVT